MFIQSQYSDDLFDIYELVVTKNINEIENKYPELVESYDQLYRVLNLYFSKYIINRSCRHVMMEWVFGTLLFIKLTNNKELIINDDIVDMIGEPSKFDFSDYVFRYISLFYPDDMVKYNINVYISHMYNVLRYMINTENIIDNKLMNNTFSNNPSLMKLLRILEDIRFNHYDIYEKGSYRFVLMLIVSYCYYKKTDYKILYNYITDPNKYIDKLDLNGYINIVDKDFVQWYKDKKEQVFLDANNFFQENDVIIK